MNCSGRINQSIKHFSSKVRFFCFALFSTLSYRGLSALLPYAFNLISAFRKSEAGGLLRWTSLCSDYIVSLKNINKNQDLWYTRLEIYKILDTKNSWIMKNILIYHFKALFVWFPVLKLYILEPSLLVLQRTFSFLLILTDVESELKIFVNIISVSLFFEFWAGDRKTF